MPDVDLSEEDGALKRTFIDETGFWNEAYDYWLRLDRGSFEVFGSFATHPWESGDIAPKEKSLILLALNGSVTELYRSGMRVHIAQAFDNGATTDEILETLELASVIGLHSTIEGFGEIREQLGCPEPDGDDEIAERNRVRELFRTRRGYWSELWESVLKMDHEYLEKFTELSSYPANRGALDPKLREFVFIAVDVSTTHLYTKGLEIHVENAIEHGASREELLELIELVSVQGYDTMLEGLPILFEAASERGRLSDS